MRLDVPKESRELVREGAHEVKEKLREDLGRWARVRRYVSLRQEIPCLACDGAGKTVCAACQGTGKSGFVNEGGEPEPCARCGGHGSITCVDCAGKGLVTNPHRKKLIWTLWAGGIAWLLILFQLWGGDILPEQRAKLLQRGEHGRGIAAPPPRHTSAPAPSVPAAPGQGQVTPTHQTTAPQYAPAPPIAQPYTPPGAGPTGISPHGNSVRGGTIGQPMSGGIAVPGGATSPYGVQGGGNSLPSRPGSWGR